MNNVINKIQKQLEELKIDSSEIVVFGSSVWEYFGIREARDIDILISDTIKKSVIGKKKNIASREIMISNIVGVGIDKFINIGINDEDFFLNSDLTFEDKGIKFVKPEIEFSRLIHRDSPQSKYDQYLITKKLIQSSEYEWDWKLVKLQEQEIIKSAFLLFFYRLYLVFKKPTKIISKLKKFKRKKMTHVSSFQDAGLFLMNQFKNGKFNRYDIIARYLVLQHNFQSDYFNNKYIEMQNKRLPNNKLSGELRLKIFSYLYQNIKKHYRYDENPIVLNKDDYLIDGSHRVAINLLLNNDLIPVIKNNKKENNYSIDWFNDNNFDSEYLGNLEEILNTLLLSRGAIFFAFVWPNANHLKDSIKNEITNNGVKIKLEINDVDVSNLNNFVKAVYLSDNVEDWKIEYKLNLFNQSKDSKFSVFGIQIDNPNWRIKNKTDSMISSNVENLKSSIRELYKKDIELTGQNKDAIIHITDNYLQNRYIYNLLKEYKIVT